MTVCGEKMSGVCGMGKCPYIKLCNKGIFDKTPYKPKTNEEWLRQCNTELLAETIADLVFESVSEFVQQRTPCNRWFEKEYWVEWLKQPHREENEK